MRSDFALRRGDTRTARESLEEALRVLGRLEFYDVYERDKKRKVIEQALLSIGR